MSISYSHPTLVQTYFLQWKHNSINHKLLQKFTPYIFRVQISSNLFANIILTTYFHIYVLRDYYQNITIFPSNIEVSPILHNIDIMWVLGPWTHGVLIHFCGPIGQMYQNFQRFTDLWLEVMYNPNFDEN